LLFTSKHFFENSAYIMKSKYFINLKVIFDKLTKLLLNQLESYKTENFNLGFWFIIQRKTLPFRAGCKDLNIE